MQSSELNGSNIFGQAHYTSNSGFPNNAVMPEYQHNSAFSDSWTSVGLSTSTPVINYQNAITQVPSVAETGNRNHVTSNVGPYDNMSTRSYTSQINGSWMNMVNADSFDSFDASVNGNMKQQSGVQQAVANTGNNASSDMTTVAKPVESFSFSNTFYDSCSVLHGHNLQPFSQ
jgi:hypothetical protein